MLLLIDNYDSFTYNLLDYLAQLGQECQVVRNDEVTVGELSPAEYAAVVISPGPGTPQDAGLTLLLIEKWHREIPILGICLGHQALGVFFGAKLVRANKPVHGKTSIITHDDHPLFHGLPSQIEVMRYHSLILDAKELADMDVIARSQSNEVMAIAHRSLPMAGFQFHPESILTTDGLELIRNWLKWAGLGQTKGVRSKA